MGALSRKQRRALLTAGVTAGVYFSFRFLLPLFLPFLCAYLIALILRPAAAFLERRLQFSIRGKRFGVSIGLIGGVLLLLLLLLLGAALFYGGQLLFAQARQLAAAVPAWFEALDQWLTRQCGAMEHLFRLREGMLTGAVRELLTDAFRTLKSAAMPNLVMNSVGAAAFVLEILILSVVLFVASILSLQEMDELRHKRYRSVFHREYFLLGRRLAMTGSAWLRTQTVILFMTSCLCILCLLLIGNPYYILGGIGIGLLDALPLFGTGTVLIPWGIFCLLGQRWLDGAVLLGLYVACYFLREFAEARMMGKKMGLSSLETLAAMYVGLKLFGFLGFILGPVGLLLIRDLVEEYDRNAVQAAGGGPVKSEPGKREPAQNEPEKREPAQSESGKDGDG